jgi:cytochrome c
MKKILAGLVLVAFLAVLGISSTAKAITEEEAKVLVGKVVAFWKANGKEKTLAEVSNPKGPFVKGDLYAFCNDTSGKVLANGGNPALVGQNHLELKDPEGKLFNKEMIEIVKTKGSGWGNYSWVNPVTKKVQPKTTFVQKIEGTDVYCGSGMWK